MDSWAAIVLHTLRVELFACLLTLPEGIHKFLFAPQTFNLKLFSMISIVVNTTLLEQSEVTCTDRRNMIVNVFKDELVEF